MTAFQDSINLALRDYVTDGVPASGPYTPLISDLKSLMNTMAVGGQFITAIGDISTGFLNAASVAAARTAIGLGSGDSPTFTGLTLSGDLTVDTNVLKVDSTNNRVGIGTATPSTGLSVALAAAFSLTLAVTGAVTFSADLTVDTTTFKVDSSNNRVGIGTASPGVTLDVVGEGRFTASGSTAALRVVQTGSGYALLIEDAASTDGSPFAIDQNGVVVAGYTAAVTAESSNVPIMQAHGTTSAASFFASRWAADALPSILRLGKSRGAAVGTRGGVSINDQLGAIYFEGDDGALFHRAAEIRAEVDLTPGSNDMPGRLVFLTTPDAGTTPTEGMRLSSTNFLSFNGDTDTGIWSPGANELSLWGGSGEAMRIDENGRIILGHTDSLTSYSGAPRLQIHGTSTSTASFGVYQESDTTAAPIIGLHKSRGTVGSPTTVNTNDLLGIIVAVGYDGSAWQRGSLIQTEVDGTVAAGQVPGRLRIYTASAAGTLTEAMRIDSSQQAYFPQHATTGTAANAVLATGSSPVGQLLRSTSSIRYKTAVADVLPGDIAKIADMRPITYRSTSPADDPYRPHLGFIAEEMAEIDPRLVHWMKLDGALVPDGVQYERLTVLLVGAVKDLTTKVQTLTTRIQALEAA